MEFQEWLRFVAIWIVVTLPVGPNAVACMTAAVSHGAWRAQWVAIGVTFASVTHSLLATFGFSALILTYGEAFHIVKWLGIAYLMSIGISIWRRSTVQDLSVRSHVSAEHWTLMRRGFLVSMSNPKAALMYLAVFVQAITPENSLAPQLALLMPTASGIVLIVYIGYVLLGVPLRRLLTSELRQRMFNRVAGSFYMITALTLALGHGPPR
jgi:homoserine/homoserine lactone efflux protein